MRYQSQIDDLEIGIPNKCVCPRPMAEDHPWDAAAEVFCTVLAALDGVQRPVIVRTLAKREGGTNRGNVTIPRTNSTGSEE